MNNTKQRKLCHSSDTPNPRIRINPTMEDATARISGPVISAVKFVKLNFARTWASQVARIIAGQNESDTSGVQGTKKWHRCKSLRLRAAVPGDVLHGQKGKCSPEQYQGAAHVMLYAPECQHLCSKLALGPPFSARWKIKPFGECRREYGQSASRHDKEEQHTVKKVDHSMRCGWYGSEVFITEVEYSRRPTRPSSSPIHSIPSGRRWERGERSRRSQSIILMSNTLKKYTTPKDQLESRGRGAVPQEQKPKTPRTSSAPIQVSNRKLAFFVSLIAERDATSFNKQRATEINCPAADSNSSTYINVPAGGGGGGGNGDAGGEQTN
ncbi:hypothetical protein BC827DRAFT_1158907 [Russula dissimulans]|nr:hypothetical protein BC827DRAFT_1158907 [Russula dissimulans]